MKYLSRCLGLLICVHLGLASFVAAQQTSAKQAEDVSQANIDRLIETINNAPLRSDKLNEAVEEACRIADKRTIPALLELADSNNFTPYDGPFHPRLAKFGSAIIPELQALATDGSERGRGRAIQTLIALDADEATPFCLESLKHRAPWFSHKPALDFLVEHQVPELDSIVAKLIQRNLENKSVESRDTANFILCLGQIDASQKSRKLLLELLQDDNSPNQNDAVRVLGQLKEEQAYNQLLKFLGDPVPEPPPSGPNVCLSQPGPNRRALAIKALANFGPKVSNKLLEFANTETRVGRGAMRVLAAQGFPKSRKLFEKTLADYEPPPQKKTFEGGQAPLAFREKSLKSISVSALGLIGDSRSIPVLINAFDKRPPLTMHDRIVEALVGFGQSARQPLLDKLSTDNEFVLSGVVTALCKIGDQRDFEKVTEVVTRKSSGKSFVKIFLQWAASIDSVESEAALRQLSKGEYYGGMARKILAERKATDSAELERSSDKAQQAVVAQQPVAVQEIIDANVGKPQWPNIFYVEMLGRRDDLVAQQAVLAALDDPELQESAIKVAQQWKWAPATDRLLQMLDETKDSLTLHRKIRWALSNMREPRLIEWLLANPFDNPQYVIKPFGFAATDAMIASIDSHRSLALSVLTSVRDPKSIPTLKKQLEIAEGKYQREHFYIVAALAAMGDEQGLELLTTRFLRPPGLSTTFTWEAIRLSCPRAKIRPHLVRLLSQKEYESLATYVLSWFGTPPDIKVIREHYPNASFEGKQKIQQLLSDLGYEATAESP